MNIRDLVHCYIVRHNEGVKTGNFHPMLALFQREAELHFEGIDYGPFNGLRAITAAFKKTPPSDELEILNATVYDASVEVTYGCRKEPGVAAGMLRLEAEGGLIKRLVVNVCRP